MKRRIAALVLSTVVSYTLTDNSFLLPPEPDKQEERIRALEDRQRERDAQERIERVKQQEREIERQSDGTHPFRGIND